MLQIIFCRFVSCSLFVLAVHPCMTHNDFGLGEAGDFHHKPACQQAGVDAEKQTLINHKCVCGAL